MLGRRWIWRCASPPNQVSLLLALAGGWGSVTFRCSSGSRRRAANSAGVRSHYLFPQEETPESESSNPRDASARLPWLLPGDAAKAPDDFKEFGYRHGCHPPDVPGLVAAKLARDVERELSFVTDDAVYAPPGGPDVVGKAALRTWWTSREATDSLEVFELDPGEIVVAGDLAYSRGTSTSRFRNRRTGQISNQVVRHLDILRRQPDGRWLISRHIRNSSGPPPQ